MLKLQHMKKLRKSTSRQSQDEAEMTTELQAALNRGEAVGHCQVTILTSESKSAAGEVGGVDRQQVTPDKQDYERQKAESETQQSPDVNEVSIVGLSEATTTISDATMSLEAPVFVQYLKEEIRVEANRSIQLKCSVKGRPMPDIEWQRNGTVVQENE